MARLRMPLRRATTSSKTRLRTRGHASHSTSRQVCVFATIVAARRAHDSQVSDATITTRPWTLKVSSLSLSEHAAPVHFRAARLANGLPRLWDGSPTAVCRDDTAVRCAAGLTPSARCSSSAPAPKSASAAPAYSWHRERWPPLIEIVRSCEPEQMNLAAAAWVSATQCASHVAYAHNVHADVGQHAALL